MGCGICAVLNAREKDFVKIYKDYFKRYGKVYYVYRTETNGGIKIVPQESFNIIFEEQIKPNFDNGAEYFHISEFTG